MAYPPRLRDIAASQYSWWPRAGCITWTIQLISAWQETNVSDTALLLFGNYPHLPDLFTICLAGTARVPHDPSFEGKIFRSQKIISADCRQSFDSNPYTLPT